MACSWQTLLGPFKLTGAAAQPGLALVTVDPASPELSGSFSQHKHLRLSTSWRKKKKHRWKWWKWDFYRPKCGKTADLNVASVLLWLQSGFNHFDSIQLISHPGLELSEICEHFSLALFLYKKLTQIFLFILALSLWAAVRRSVFTHAHSTFCPDLSRLTPADFTWMNTPRVIMCSIFWNKTVVAGAHYFQSQLVVLFLL